MYDSIEDYRYNTLYVAMFRTSLLNKCFTHQFRVIQLVVTIFSHHCNLPYGLGRGEGREPYILRNRTQPILLLDFNSTLVVSDCVCPSCSPLKVTAVICLSAVTDQQLCWLAPCHCHSQPWLMLWSVAVTQGKVQKNARSRQLSHSHFNHCPLSLTR